ncbi:MAG TPA: HypC/HybG/HupF family hydrogenase formation chaperone [Labilithrix sp.]|nr:HypC/HybG/HupF family hydrogenase formation chaperone [Labilithrix sp.]
MPGRLLSTFEEHGLRMGSVDFGGVKKNVCLEHVPEATPGDFVLVHVGFALARIDEAEAERTFALLRELGALEEDLA